LESKAKQRACYLQLAELQSQRARETESGAGCGVVEQLRRMCSIATDVAPHGLEAGYDGLEKGYAGYAMGVPRRGEEELAARGGGGTATARIPGGGGSIYSLFIAHMSIYGNNH